MAAGLSQRQVDTLRRTWNKAPDRAALAGAYIGEFFARCPKRDADCGLDEGGALLPHERLREAALQDQLQGVQQVMDAVGSLLACVDDSRLTKDRLELIAWRHARAGSAEAEWAAAGCALLAAAAAASPVQFSDDARQLWQQVWECWGEQLLATHRLFTAGEPPPVGALSEASPLQVYHRACRELRIRRPSSAVEGILAAAGSFSELRDLNLSGGYLGCRGVLALLWVVERGCSLQQLGLAGVGIHADEQQTPQPRGSPVKSGAELLAALGEDGRVDGNVTVSCLCQALIRGGSVTVLDLSDNALAAHSGRWLMRLCQALPSLEELHLAGTLVPARLLRGCQSQLARNRRDRRKGMDAQPRARHYNTIPMHEKTDEVRAQLGAACARTAVLSGHGEREDAAIVAALAPRAPIQPGEVFPLAVGDIGLLLSGDAEWELNPASTEDAPPTGSHVSAGGVIGLYPLPAIDKRGKVIRQPDGPQRALSGLHSSPLLCSESDLPPGLTELTTSDDFPSGLSQHGEWRAGAQGAEWWALPRAAAYAIVVPAAKHACVRNDDLLRFLPAAAGLHQADRQHLLSACRRVQLGAGQAAPADSPAAPALLWVDEGALSVGPAGEDGAGLLRRGSLISSPAAAAALGCAGAASRSETQEVVAAESPTTLLLIPVEAAASSRAVRDALRTDLLRYGVPGDSSAALRPAPPLLPPGALPLVP